MIFHCNNQYDQKDIKDAGRIPIACDCWFTASGTLHPRFIKLQTDEGYVSIKIHQILYQEERSFAGMPVTVSVCSIHDGDILRHLKLYYFHLECYWKMEWMQDS